MTAAKVESSGSPFATALVVLSVYHERVERFWMQCRGISVDEWLLTVWRLTPSQRVIDYT